MSGDDMLRNSRFHKMVNREVPAYLSNLLPDTLSNLHHHFTRRSQNISAIQTRTCLYAGYYLPSSIKLWNELTLEFRNISSPDIFKKRLKVINKKRPSYYYIVLVWIADMFWDRRVKWWCKLDRVSGNKLLRYAGTSLFTILWNKTNLWFVLRSASFSQPVSW
jgi:hypothetical protein